MKSTDIEPVAGPVENWAWKPISTVDGNFDIETVLAVDDTRYYPERYRYSDYFLARGSHNDVKMSNLKWSTNFGHKLRGDFHTSPPLQQA